MVKADDEQELQSAWWNGDFRAVAELAFRRYGPEILRVLVARLGSESDASEAFSMFVEDLLRGLPGFQWRCSLRAWAHRIARNAAARWITAGERSPERNLSIEHDGALEVVDHVRSSTLLHLRTEVKSEIRRLRDELPEVERMLLILRVDQGLGWDEIAALHADDDLADEELKREAARLRKRFELATKKLRAVARERGLVPR